MSYSKLAKYCSIGGTIGSLVLDAVIVTRSSVGLWYLPFAVIVPIVVGVLTYQLIRLAWTLNEEELSKKGHRW